MICQLELTFIGKTSKVSWHENMNQSSGEVMVTGNMELIMVTLFLLHALWVRLLLIGACPAVHSSLGAESPSYTSLEFLSP